MERMVSWNSRIILPLKCHSLKPRILSLITPCTIMKDCYRHGGKMEGGRTWSWEECGKTFDGGNPAYKRTRGDPQPPAPGPNHHAEPRPYAAVTLGCHYHTRELFFFFFRITKLLRVSSENIRQSLTESQSKELIESDTKFTYHPKYDEFEKKKKKDKKINWLRLWQEKLIKVNQI